MKPATAEGSDKSCYLENDKVATITLFFLSLLRFSAQDVQSKKDSSSKQNPNLRMGTNYCNVYMCESPHRYFSTSSAQHLERCIWVCPVDYTYCSLHHFRSPIQQLLSSDCSSCKPVSASPSTSESCIFK